MRIIDFFVKLISSILGANSPEMKIKRELRVIENSLKSSNSVLYKNGFLHPNFAESMYQMYIHTRRYRSLLSSTLFNVNLRIKNRYTELLFFTNLSGEELSLYDSLSYERRKQELVETNSQPRTSDEQRRNIDRFMASFTRAEFPRTDAAIAQLEHFFDICSYDYTSILHAFDPDLDGEDSHYDPNFQPVPAAELSNRLKALYYVATDFVATTTTGRALIALEELRRQSKFAGEETQIFLGPLKKIAYILSHILDEDTQLKLCKLADRDPYLTLQKAEYASAMLSSVVTRLKERFDADRKQILMEIRDENIQSEVHKLFGDRELVQLHGYNTQTNSILRSVSHVSFEYITPLQIFKNFFIIYFDEKVQNLLNDIVIEGFFNNVTYKTEFSSLVYTCAEIPLHMAEFERKFRKRGPYDEAILLGYVNDSHKDSNFVRNLSDTIISVNEEARKFIQREIAVFADLVNRLGELMIDVKKSHSDVISNIRLLFSSTRNKETAERLEKEFPQWYIFLNIMKNYTVVQEIEKT